MVVAAADSEELLWTINIITEVEVIYLISITLVAVGFQEQIHG